MKLFEQHQTDRTPDQLPEFPPDVEVPDDISGIGPPTSRKPETGGVRWMRWLAAIVVLGVAGVLAAQLLSSSDPDPVDYMATYGTDNPVIVQEGAAAGTVEIVGTANLMELYGTDNPAFVQETPYMELYGTDNPAFVQETPYMELYGTDNPAFVQETPYMELYGTDNPVIVPETAPTGTVDAGQYMEFYGTDNPVLVTEGS